MTSEISEDSLLDGKIRLRQPADGYRVAIDPVFLAASVPAQAGETILDLGSGVGAASLCLAWRVPGSRLFGLEMQPELVALARDNAALNGFAGRIDNLIGTIRNPPPRLAPGNFHHVMTNPPFNEAGRGTASPRAGKNAANQESEVDLEGWMRFALTMLRPKGSLSVIYRADRLDDLMAVLNGRLGEIAVLPLWPKEGRPAKRIILCGRKGVASPTTLLPGLVLHREDGRYSDAAEAILRDGVGLV